MALCIPDNTDWGCALTDVEIESLDPTRKARAERLAWSSLVRLTGQRLSLCPVAVRPCAARILPLVTYEDGAGISGAYAPYNYGGQWFNACGCNAGGCQCDGRGVIRLPGEVGAVVSILIDGAELERSAYRVDNGNLLVRQDGAAWPISQDMSAPIGDVGTFVVNYYPGVAPDEELAWAAGRLAVEWYKACSGIDCALPTGVERVARQGISFTIPSGVFENGLSGIREVDAITGLYNPNRLKTPPRVVSPDRMRAARMRTA